MDLISDNIKDAIIHYSNVTQSDNPMLKSSYLFKTDLAPSLYDVGSGLSCSSDRITYYLKGVYVRKRETGLVEIKRLDTEWIQHLFSVNFETTSSTAKTTTAIKVTTTSFYNKTKGECSFNAQRKFVSCF